MGKRYIVHFKTNKSGTNVKLRNVAVIAETTMEAILKARLKTHLKEVYGVSVVGEEQELDGKKMTE